jgi:hypothetical protein
MNFRPREHSETKIDLATGITWTCDDTSPAVIRGVTLRGGVPCFIGHIDYAGPAVKFAAAPGSAGKTVVVRITSDRADLAKLAADYASKHQTAEETPIVPPKSLRAAAIRETDADPLTPPDLAKAIRDPRRDWTNHEDADYAIHGAN